MHFLLWTKGSHENTNFDIFKCSDENLLNSSCHFPNHESVFLQILRDSSVWWNMLHCTFLGQMLYTLHKSDQSKCNFFGLFRAQIKIHQILVIFETKNKFFFKFCPTLIVRIGGINHPSKTPPPSFLPSPPLIYWQTVQAPLFRQSPPLYCFFVNPPKSWIFQWNPKILKFLILRPSSLLKVTKFLAKISQFEFLVMTEKNVFAYKLFCH